MTFRSANCHATGVARGEAGAAGHCAGLHVRCRRTSDDEETLFGGTWDEGDLKVEAACAQRSHSSSSLSAAFERQVVAIGLTSAATHSAAPTVGRQADSCAARGTNLADDIDSEVTKMHDDRRQPAGIAVATDWRRGLSAATTADTLLLLGCRRTLCPKHIGVPMASVLHLVLSQRCSLLA